MCSHKLLKIPDIRGLSYKHIYKTIHTIYSVMIINVIDVWEFRGVESY